MKILLLTAALTLTAVSFAGFTQDFDDIGDATTNGQLEGANLEAQGWFLKNQSATAGLSDWFQGNPAVFSAQSGATDAYIGANFDNGAGTTTISNWLITPVVTLENGATFKFWTRKPTTSNFPDRLRVFQSTSGNSTNTGTLATDTGDFSTLLLDINPSYSTVIYPNVWTEFTIVIAGVANPTQGRLAFNYFVENGGPTGTRSDYIGIDTVSYVDAIPEPATLTVLAGAAVAALARRRK